MTPLTGHNTKFGHILIIICAMTDCVDRFYKSDFNSEKYIIFNE